jgi:hypothetical protein
MVPIIQVDEEGSIMGVIRIADINVRAGTLIAIVVFSLLCASSSHSQSSYIWGNSSAREVNDQGLEGYWQYCVSIGWDVMQYPEGPHGASHASIILGLEECLADCGGACFVLPDTVGIGDGADGCTVYYYAELDSRGDPTVPPTVPTIKFEPYPSACEPDIVGVAHVCFYSLIPPEAGDTPPASVWIKFGTYLEEGLITGMLPSCRGTAASDRSTWGSIKGLFR